MVIELLIVWGIGVVAFFALWAILAKVIKRISERKQKDMPKEDSSTEDLQQEPENNSQSLNL